MIKQRDSVIILKVDDVFNVLVGNELVVEETSNFRKIQILSGYKKPPHSQFP